MGTELEHFDWGATETPEQRLTEPDFPTQPGQLAEALNGIREFARRYMTDPDGTRIPYRGFYRDFND